MNLSNVGMAQPSNGLGLLDEAGLLILILSCKMRQELQGNLTLKSSILGKLHLPHPTGTELFEDLIMTYLLILHNEGILPGWGTGSEGDTTWFCIPKCVLGR